jgi:hypothetical protein
MGFFTSKNSEKLRFSVGLQKQGVLLVIDRRSDVYKLHSV